MARASTDTVIIGGGIAGLWLLRRLLAEGRSAVLLEATALGAGQTAASQGMVHGGIKYALNATLTGASEAIAGMPARWRACLAGTGEIDLRTAEVLSPHYDMWSNGNLRGRLGSFLASKALRGRVDPLAAGDLPQAFRDPAFKGQVYRLQDVVLDVPSTLAALAAPCGDRVRRLAVAPEHLDLTARCLRWQGPDGRVELAYRNLVLTAGAGTAALLPLLGAGAPAMQRRPLHQVMVLHRYPHPIHAHCISAITRPEPRLTVTTHPLPDGRSCFYLGGGLSTGGVDRSDAAQIAVARSELAECLPWIDLSDATFASWRGDRAEPAQRRGLKPDQAFAERVGDTVVAWPTKLSLAPDLADRANALLPPVQVPAEGDGIAGLCSTLPAVPVAQPPWLQAAGLPVAGL